MPVQQVQSIHTAPLAPEVIREASDVKAALANEKIGAPAVDHGNEAACPNGVCSTLNAHSVKDASSLEKTRYEQLKAALATALEKSGQCSLKAAKTAARMAKQLIATGYQMTKSAATKLSQIILKHGPSVIEKMTGLTVHYSVKGVAYTVTLSVDIAAKLIAGKDLDTAAYVSSETFDKALGYVDWSAEKTAGTLSYIVFLTANQLLEKGLPLTEKALTLAAQTAAEYGPVAAKEFHKMLSDVTNKVYATCAA